MGFDVLLIAVIVGGIALSAAYVRAEYLGWREHGSVQRRRDAALRERHTASLSEPRDALLPSVLKLQEFGEIDAANPDSAGEFGSSRRDPYPSAKFRKRARQRAR
jgi:hypothetical protein